MLAHFCRGIPANTSAIPERHGPRQMRKLHTFKSPIGNCAATTAFALSLFGLFLFAGPAYAQFGASASQSQQGAQATALPLSGRGGASGGVGTTPTARPGTTREGKTPNPTPPASR